MSFLEEKLPFVRGFEGCLSVTILLDEDSGRMVFEEEWRSVADHQNYLASIADNGVMNELISFLQGPPEIKYFEQVVI
jgi:quinol monooxygenase YgiN